MRNKLLIILAALTAVWWFVELTDPIGAFVREARLAHRSADRATWSWNAAQTAFSPSGERQPALEDRVRAEAQRRHAEPVDARLDRVWQAIPDYNGLEVDIAQSLRLAALHPDRDPPPVVTREIPAKVTLDDLGPHPIYKGNPNKPMVALMINVAWGEEFLPDMLATLRKENVRATFFFDGSWLSQHIDTARLIGEQGHELSNHAYSHKNMSQLSAARARLEIAKTEKLLRDQLGVTNRWFAPPSGDYDDETVRLAAEQGLKTVLWSLDTLDWKHPGATVIVNKIRTRIEPGTLVLMHPTVSSRDALQSMIRVIKGKGLLLGTVSETLSPQRVPGR